MNPSGLMVSRGLGWASLCFGLSIVLAFSGCTVAKKADMTRPVAETKPRAARQKPFLFSPVVEKSDVTFYFDAPGAREVLVHGQWGGWKTEAMARDERGVWTLKVAGMPAGIWSYYFEMDGQGMNDPLNPVMQASREMNASVVQVASDPPAPWDLQDVPHGVLHRHKYFSKALGREREMIVYTPAGYGAEGAAALPVLYLAHGLNGNETSWTVEGKADLIADALIADKRAVPMVIVMTNAHAVVYKGEKFEKYLPVNTEAFIKELREDVRPLVEGSYHVRRDGDGRAFVGLSMGGCEAWTLGLNYPDEFTWIGALSASTVQTEKIRWALDHPAEVNAKLHMLWAPAGKWEEPEHTQKFVEKLKAAGIKAEFEVVEGDHSWPNWRGDLVKVMPRLFR